VGAHDPGKDLVLSYAPLKGLDLSQVSGTLTGNCGLDPGIACRLVWDVSHDGTAARLTAVYLAHPINLVLRLAWLVFLALLARAVVHRLINRITVRAADAPLHNRLRQGTGGRARQRPWRRRPRAAAADLPGQAEATSVDAVAPDEVATAAAVHEAASERRHQRAHALGSILRSAASVTIFAISGTIALGDLGVNLAPVLASAGVVGVAVGFGAQNLVRDFLAGIFMLLEDQYGVGDVINIGDATGTVEAVSLRTTRLRDVNGVVWHLRNGALEKIGNESQGWARAVVDVPIPQDRDIPSTRQLMEQAAIGMWRERRWRKLMLEKPEVWGVQDIADSQIVMRVAAKTLPLRQWEIGRELRERVLSVVDLPPPPDPDAGLAGASRKTARRAAQASAGQTRSGMPPLETGGGAGEDATRERGSSHAERGGGSPAAAGAHLTAEPADAGANTSKDR
jgi:moderate conductance mechanosensitive channel